MALPTSTTSTYGVPSFLNPMSGYSCMGPSVSLPYQKAKMGQTWLACTCVRPEERDGIYFCEHGNFAYIDPSGPCVDDGDVTAEVVANCGYIGSIGRYGRRILPVATEFPCIPCAFLVFFPIVVNGRVVFVRAPGSRISWRKNKNLIISCFESAAKKMLR